MILTAQGQVLRKKCVAKLLRPSMRKKSVAIHRLAVLSVEMAQQEDDTWENFWAV